jgi:tRNA pseudouridine13 synthase
MAASDWALPEWQRYCGQPVASGKLRATPEDFQVWELPLVEPQGSGSHLWLEICKRGANTQWVAEQLAAAAGVPVRDVGFAGMKDRHAITTQWFSIGLQNAAGADRSDWANWDISGVSILRAERHVRKLRRGALRGNRFRIVLRDVQGNLDGLRERLACLARRGVPNYFGPQRFGRAGANLPRAVHWLEHGGRIKRSLRSIYLSTARAFLFNALLSERVRRDNWDRLVDGDLAMLDGSSSIFACGVIDPELRQRCAKFDIHPTGPLAGRGGERGAGRTTGEAAALEVRVLESHSALVNGLEKAGVEAGRRSLRVLPGAFQWSMEQANLTLEFTLPSGAFATSVVRELVLTDPGTISISK